MCRNSLCFMLKPERAWSQLRTKSENTWLLTARALLWRWGWLCNTHRTHFSFVVEYCGSTQTRTVSIHGVYHDVACMRCPLLVWMWVLSSHRLKGSPSATGWGGWLAADDVEGKGTNCMRLRWRTAFSMLTIWFSRTLPSTVVLLRSTTQTSSPIPMSGKLWTPCRRFKYNSYVFLYSCSSFRKIT